MTRSHKVTDLAESDRQMALRKRQQNWVRGILDGHNLNYVRLAEMCGFDRTTLTRLFARDGTQILRSDTVDKIAAVFGPMENGKVKPLIAPVKSGAASPSLVEASPFAANDDAALADIVTAVRAGRPACNPFELGSDQLAMLGYMRGDILFVDQNARPAEEDLVCVQLYNWDGTSAGTVFRILQGDYLTLPAAIGVVPPAPIDMRGAKLVVMGPVTEMVRPRRLSQRVA